MPRAKKSDNKQIEQYDHKGKERLNNPPIGLVDSQTDREIGKKTYAYDPHIDPSLQFDSQRSQIEKIIDNGIAAETLEEAKAALFELKKCQEPYLNWAGKAEHISFEVPTVSLHVHERIDPRTIIEAVRKRKGIKVEQLFLFASPEENPPIREAIQFYKHKHNWSNRLIAGDSLLVMNSLIEKEGMAGQVQMIYIDPPYGIKYGSNFQPFINKRDVKDGKGDRLLLAREILTESGSIFVQISDENLHHVRELLDEVFGAKNFCSIIAFTKAASGLESVSRVGSRLDYLVWYSKDSEQAKYRPLFEKRSDPIDSGFTFVELPDGTRRSLNTEE